MSVSEPSTRTRILEATREIMMTRGMGEFTIQAVAQELGITKQAILYWFPNKTALVNGLIIDAFEEEANVLVSALKNSPSAEAAIEAFLLQGMDHHTKNLPLFRLAYLAPQVDRSLSKIATEMKMDPIYEANARLYDALEGVFSNHPGFPKDVNPRTFGVSLHMALLGHVCLYGTMHAINDSFKQPFNEILISMTAIISNGITKA